MVLIGRKRIFLLVAGFCCLQLVYLIFVLSAWKMRLVNFSKDSYSGELGRTGVAIGTDLFSATRTVLPNSTAGLSDGAIVGSTEIIRGNASHAYFIFEYFNSKLPSNIGRAHQMCQAKTTYAVAVIDSAPESGGQRAVIRDTWGGEELGNRLGVVTLFVMGYPVDDVIMTSINEEQLLYGDILMGNYKDSVRNYTLNMLLALKWATSVCPSAEFVIFGNDRMIYMFDTLVHQLRTFTKDETANMWYGRRTRFTTPDRNINSVYFVSNDQYPDDVYPDFCSSKAGYVLSMTSARAMLKLSWGEPLIPVPDVFLGILANTRSSIIISHDDRFSLSKDAFKNRCSVANSFTVMAPTTRALIRELWIGLQNVKFRRQCPNPDLDAVIATNVNNTKYINEALAPILKHSDFCLDSSRQPKDIFLIALISTHPKNVERRHVIRDTWGAQKTVLGENIRVLFAMGSSVENTKTIQEQVKNEDEQYGDIVQVEFMESFKNLTLKVVLGLQWVTENCQNARYMYKGDDDVFVHLENIIKFIKSGWPKSLTNFFVGSRLYKSPRITNTNSKYYVPETLYKGRFFPPYCSGGGYVMSADVVPKLYTMAKTTEFLPIDDAYQGILMKRIGVTPVNNDWFMNWGYRTDPCSLRKVMVIHFQTQAEKNKMRDVWTNFTKPVTCL